MVLQTKCCVYRSTLPETARPTLRIGSMGALVVMKVVGVEDGSACNVVSTRAAVVAEADTANAGNSVAH